MDEAIDTEKGVLLSIAQSVPAGSVRVKVVPSPLVVDVAAVQVPVVPETKLVGMLDAEEANIALPAVTVIVPSTASAPELDVVAPKLKRVGVSPVRASSTNIDALPTLMESTKVTFNRPKAHNNRGIRLLNRDVVLMIIFRTPGMFTSCPKEVIHYCYYWTGSFFAAECR